MNPANEANEEVTFEAIGTDTTLPAGAQPSVRVGVLSGYDQMDFRVKGPFSIVTLDGDTLYENIETDRRWRCKIDDSETATFVYSIVLGSFADIHNANRLADNLEEKGYNPRIVPLGRELKIGGDVVHEGMLWRVLVGSFENEEAALPELKVFSSANTPAPRILRSRTRDAYGVIELYDAEYDRNGMIKNGFRLVPESGDTEITVYDIRIGEGFHWEHVEDRTYKGVIEMRIAHEGDLLVLNEILLDEYLKGVVPSEMHHTFPMEALKAQAVAARSYTVARLCRISPNEPIDFPASVAFQVYSGITHARPETDQAVDSTAGEVLKVDNRVCEAFFSSNSGGHTESKANWNPPGAPYLEGIPLLTDPAKFTYDLTREVDVERWVNEYPESYSNPRGTGIEMLDRNARYFRWEVTYARRALEKIIKRKLGFDIGTLIDLQPLQRGVSGRIIELEILGSHRNYTLKGELNIRRALSETTLASSCFIVETVIGDLGNPIELTFIGAGFGHGVGMDQTAAGVMAHTGKKYKTILKTFYSGAKLEKIW